MQSYGFSVGYIKRRLSGQDTRELGYRFLLIGVNKFTLAFNKLLFTNLWHNKMLIILRF